MSRKIYTYSKLDTIEKSKYFNEYSMYPQVTVSSEIAWALNCEKKVFGGKKTPVFWEKDSWKSKLREKNQEFSEWYCIFIKNHV